MGKEQGVKSSDPLGGEVGQAALGYWQCETPPFIIPTNYSQSLWFSYWLELNCQNYLEYSSFITCHDPRQELGSREQNYERLREPGDKRGYADREQQWSSVNRHSQSMATHREEAGGINALTTLLPLSGGLLGLPSSSTQLEARGKVNPFTWSTHSGFARHRAA